ncbi:MAG: YcjX family protein [Hyphomicrobium sp.]
MKGVLRDVLTPTLRLGVTGLSRAGKTVFITALVRNLQGRGNFPFFTPEAEGRLLDAILEPQPDDNIPRFDFEEHCAALSRSPPEWPESTKRISELRLSLTFKPTDFIRRSLKLSHLHIDIMDYPGEWLIDLCLLDQSYKEWSRETFQKAQKSKHKAEAEEWIKFSRSKNHLKEDPEQIAIQGARIFTEYLRSVKVRDEGVGTFTPGRFLMPGDLAGSPLLTFFPLDFEKETAIHESPLRHLLEKRFESYKTYVVRPFFRDYFVKLDRQIVLIDILGALSRGKESLQQLEETLTSLLKAFRPGPQSWLSRYYRKRIDRILFAATKADHISQKSHDRLEAILAKITERASRRAAEAGAEVKVMAISALRATREAEVTKNGEILPCISGIPMPQQKIGKLEFDGMKEAVIFPGDLPEDPNVALARSGESLEGVAATFIRFRPPSLGEDEKSFTKIRHIRLDRALDYLIGDWMG